MLNIIFQTFAMSDRVSLDFTKLLDDLDNEAIKSGKYIETNSLFQNVKDAAFHVGNWIANMDASCCTHVHSVHCLNCRRMILGSFDARNFITKYSHEFAFVKVGINLNGEFPDANAGIPFTVLTLEEFNKICTKGCFVKAVVLKVSKIIVVFYYMQGKGSNFLTKNLYAELMKTVNN